MAARKRKCISSDDEDYSCSASDEEPNLQHSTDGATNLKSEVAKLRLLNHNLSLEVASLKKQLAKLGASANSQPKALDPQAIDKARKNIIKQMESVMVYKKGLKRARSRLNVQVPNFTLEQVKQVLGSKLAAAASNGPQQFKAKVSSTDLEDAFEMAPSKSLRYGAYLKLEEAGVTFTYTKSDSLLTITGYYTMY